SLWFPCIVCILQSEALEELRLLTPDSKYGRFEPQRHREHRGCCFKFDAWHSTIQRNAQKFPLCRVPKNHRCSDDIVLTGIRLGPKIRDGASAGDTPAENRDDPDRRI